ncbi:MAG: hypothetical protein WCD69_12345 [Xanthobacteraceae bacterium]
MLNNLSEKMRECYRKAEDCARKAAAETDPQLKRDFLDNERRWLLLAQSYDFTGRLNDFSAEAKRRIARPTSVYYALHIHRKDGHQQTEYNRHEELPKLGALIPVTLGGEAINARVLSVITSPAKAFARLVHTVYAVEV